MSLKKQLEDILCNLNKAYQKLEYNKTTLNQQSDNVKEQIKNNIIMQIDALNQRKLWLLNQLELVKSDKMESIHRKQDAIKCSLSNIQKLLSDPPKYSNNQIKESIESINSLMSEETRPFIAFRSDPALLREIISQYGVILKQYCGHFADPARPSISLPSVVEEEDDEDSLTFTRKEDTAKNEENSVLRVTNFPANSAIVRAWLMTTNDFANNIDVEVVTPKSDDTEELSYEAVLKPMNQIILSDSDSFIRVESTEGSELKMRGNGLSTDHDLNNKETWLSDKGKLHVAKDFSDVVKPFIEIRNQNNFMWLSKPCEIDEDKDVDHRDLVKRACAVGNCKSFKDCCEIENCCKKLIDPTRPAWNKWMLDNDVFKLDLIKTQISGTIQDINFSKEFTKVLKSDNEKWLHPRKCPPKSIAKRTNDSVVLSKDVDIDKTANINSEGRGLIFEEPLEKWIGYGRELEWKKSKRSLLESVNQSFEKMNLDELDGLMNNCDAVDMSKWLVDQKM